MRLCHNMNSLSLYNKYKKNLSVSQSTLNKITSGVKINSAKDNPDKIGQSEAMRISNVEVAEQRCIISFSPDETFKTLWR